MPLDDTEHLFTYPRGWFMVTRGDELKAGVPMKLNFFGRKIRGVPRRGRQSGGAGCAPCPHMGASLAVGSTVDEGGVRCPFHRWRFAADGKCNDIPYSKIIPPKAKVNSYPARELNGNVFMWHDPEFGAPDYELPDMAEYRESEMGAVGRCFRKDIQHRGRRRLSITSPTRRISRSSTAPRSPSSRTPSSATRPRNMR